MQHLIIDEKHQNYEVLALYKEQQDRTLDPIEEGLFLPRYWQSDKEESVFNKPRGLRKQR